MNRWYISGHSGTSRTSDRTCQRDNPERTAHGRAFPSTSCSCHIQSSCPLNLHASFNFFPVRSSRSIMVFQLLDTELEDPPSWESERCTRSMIFLWLKVSYALEKLKPSGSGTSMQMRKSTSAQRISMEGGIFPPRRHLPGHRQSKMQQVGVIMLTGDATTNQALWFGF